MDMLISSVYTTAASLLLLFVTGQEQRVPGGLVRSGARRNHRPRMRGRGRAAGFRVWRIRPKWAKPAIHTKGRVSLVSCMHMYCICTHDMSSCFQFKSLATVGRSHDVSGPHASHFGNLLETFWKLNLSGNPPGSRSPPGSLHLPPTNHTFISYLAG